MRKGSVLQVVLSLAIQAGVAFPSFAADCSRYSVEGLMPGASHREVWKALDGKGSERAVVSTERGSFSTAKYERPSGTLHVRYDSKIGRANDSKVVSLRTTIAGADARELVLDKYGEPATGAKLLRNATATGIATWIDKGCRVTVTAHVRRMKWWEGGSTVIDLQVKSFASDVPTTTAKLRRKPAISATPQSPAIPETATEPEQPEHPTTAPPTGRVLVEERPAMPPPSGEPKAPTAGSVAAEPAAVTARPDPVERKPESEVPNREPPTLRTSTPSTSPTPARPRVVEDDTAVSRTTPVAPTAPAKPELQDDYVAQEIVPVAVADLTLRRSTSSDSPAVGNDVASTLTLSNAGPSAATGIVVHNRLPSGFRYVNDDGKGSYDRETGTWDVGTLAANASVTLTVTALVEQEGKHSGVAEIAAANEKDPDSTPNNRLRTEDDYVEYTVSPVPFADLALTQTVDDDEVVVGTEVVVKTRVHNAGPSEATRVVVTTRLPSGYEFVSDDGGGAYSPRSGKWKVGRLAAGGEATLGITASVKAIGDHAITAEVTEAGQRDPDSSPDNRVTSEDDFVELSNKPIAVADLSLTQVVDNPTPDVGGSVVFTLTVRNKGPSDATGVVVRDRLPSGYRYLRHRGAGVYDAESGEWVVGALPSRSVAILQITAKVNAQGEYQNVAEITKCDQQDPDSRPGGQLAEDRGRVATP